MSKEERLRAAAGKLKYTEIKPGAFDPKARLAEVAIDDIQQSVVYPTLMLGLPGFPDAEFAEVQASAYNRWVAEYCALRADPPVRRRGRSRSRTSSAPLRVIREAKELGLVGIFLRPNPSVDGTYFSDAMYEPIWALCEELDLTIGFHPYLAADMPGACRNLHLWNYRAPGGTVDFVEAMSQSPITSLHNIFFSQGAVERLRHDDHDRDHDRRRRARAPSRGCAASSSRPTAAGSRPSSSGSTITTRSSAGTCRR